MSHQSSLQEEILGGSITSACTHTPAFPTAAVLDHRLTHIGPDCSGRTYTVTGVVVDIDPAVDQGADTTLIGTRSDLDFDSRERCCPAVVGRSTGSGIGTGTCYNTEYRERCSEMMG